MLLLVVFKWFVFLIIADSMFPWYTYFPILSFLEYRSVSKQEILTQSSETSTILLSSSFRCFSRLGVISPSNTERYSCVRYFLRVFITLGSRLAFTS